MREPHPFLSRIKKMHEKAKKNGFILKKKNCVFSYLFVMKIFLDVLLYYHKVVKDTFQLNYSVFH